ncbi:MAG TPA: sigma-70 family RNA polymerase sigma factor [Balneolales bacterium]|nr:sigma-70 family RNA polymerase sigma factor [Balneolales bacterium]
MRNTQQEDFNGLPVDDKISEESSEMTFDEICNVYSGRILNLAYRMTGDEEVSRDLTQDVFLKVYEKRESFQERSSLYTWIYRIAVNHVLNYLKKERRYQWLRILDQPISEAIHEDHIDPEFWGSHPAKSADKQMEARERESIVRSMIHSLPAKYRVPLVLYRYEEFSYKEIAETMNLSLSAVESRIHRANKKLIVLLEPWIDKI